MIIAKTPAEVAKSLRGFFETNINALQGVIEKLPEGIRGDLKKLHDDLNTQLAKLPPLEQVPAATEAAGCLNYIGDCIVRMQEYAAGLMERMNRLAKDLETRNSAYQGLEAKLSAEYVTNVRAQELCSIAKKEGVDSVMPMIVAMRRTQVELAGLPIAGDEILNLPQDQFAARIDAAKANVTKLGEHGYKKGGKGDGLVQELAWLPATDFATKLTKFGDILGKPQPAGDPLLGNGSPAGAGATDPKAAKAFMMA